MAASWVPNFDWLTEDLALGGAFPPERTGELAARWGIGAVVDVRAEACDDGGVLQACGIEFLHLPTPDLEGLTPAMLEAGVAFARQAREAGRKLLVHCEHGIGRSATLGLCLLVDRGLEPLAALSLAKDARALVSPSLSQYRAWADWLEHTGRGPPPSYDAFGRIAYRHLAATRA